MKKRLLSICAALSLIVNIMAVPASALGEREASKYSNIEIGDYIELGHYLGEPIVWRCVGIDEHGPLMLSDKVLCLKAYDAKGDSDTHYVPGQFSDIRKYYGSNCWSDSNLREWLNSDEESISWSHDSPSSDNVYNGYNAYDSEAGFLTCFTDEELSYISNTTQKVYTNQAEFLRNLTDGGNSEYLLLSGQHIQDLSLDFSDIYYQYVTDKFFVPNIIQLMQAYSNIGEDYIIAYPTKQAVTTSNFTHPEFSENMPCAYWINHPGVVGYSYEHMNTIGRDGNMSSTKQWDDNNEGAYISTVGVRPAFYLNTDNDTNEAGDNAENPDGATDITGTFISEKAGGGEMEYPFTYSDSYFTNSPFNYHHDLATMSLCLAMSAFNSKTNTDHNVKQLLNKCGFDDALYKSYGYCDENGNSIEPTMDSIAVAFSQKDIGDSIIIAIAVRGGKYEKEWGGNFEIGTEQFMHHSGFDTARVQVVNYFKKYLNENKELAYSTKDIKLWIVGYSRGAATANLVAANLSQRDDILLPEGWKNNIYAYTFETPLNTTDSNANTSQYNYIFNIINPSDIVTKVAPSIWGFSRYGKNVYLPSAESKSHYFELSQKMKNMYTKITNNNTFPYDSSLWISVSDNELIPNITITPSAYVQNVVDSLAKNILKNRNYYATTYQNFIKKVSAAILGKGEATSENNFLNDLSDLVLNSTVSGSFIEGVLRTYSQELNLATEAEIISGRLLIYEILNNADILVPQLIPLIKDGLFDYHQPILCLSWMMSLTDNKVWQASIENNDANLYRILYINCPVDVEVYDESQKMVSAIYNNEVQPISNSTITSYIDWIGQKIVYLPSDMEYTVKLSATDTGTVTYTVLEHDMEKGKTTKAVSYFDIKVKEGDLIYGTLESLVDVPDTHYKLMLGEDLQVADIYQIGNEVKTCSVTLNSLGNGQVFGANEYTNGEFAKVKAVADEGYDFAGWYIDNKLVSTEEEYRFLVKTDVLLTGRFITSETDINVVGLSLDKPSILLTVSNTTEKLIPIFIPNNATNKVVAWTSSNPSIATVTNTGLVTAVSDGVATITATTQDGGYTATCEVTVALLEGPGIPVTGVELNVQKIELTRAGDVYQIEADITPINATNQTVIWSSSNSRVATVTGGGLVTAVSNGVTTITATTQDGGYTATCEVRVKLPEGSVIPVTGVELNTQRIKLNRIGDVYQIEADITPINATNQAVTWASSNPNVATVTDTGLVTAVSEGTATITVTTEDGQKVATCTVTVRIESGSGGTGVGGSSGSTTPASYTITSEYTVGGAITISPKTASKGQTVTITAVPDDGFALKTLSVTDKNGNKIELTKQTETSYTFKMPASKVTVSATFTEIVVEPEPIILPFDDISQSAWYYGAVEYVYSNDMMQGTSATRFSPEVEMSRGMIATVLYRLENTPALTGSTSFSDVGGNEWYTDAIQWAAENNIMSGYGNNRFGPMDSVTREQLAVILYNYTASNGISVEAAGDLSVFHDAEDTSDWAEEAISWAVGVGLLSGKGNGILDPTGTATRAEVAQILMNYCTKVA